MRKGNILTTCFLWPKIFPFSGGPPVVGAPAGQRAFPHGTPHEWVSKTKPTKTSTDYGNPVGNYRAAGL